MKNNIPYEFDSNDVFKFADFMHMDTQAKGNNLYFVYGPFG